MIELNKPNWTALPKKASLTAEDLTPHYTLTKISDNNYHFFNAETKSGQVLSTQEAIHKLAHLSGKLLSKDHIKAIESLASFDSMIIPTSAVRPSKITTTASAETMSVDPWKLIEVNGTKYFVRNTEEAETIEKHASELDPTNLNKMLSDEKAKKRTEIVKGLVDEFNVEHPDALSIDDTSDTNKVLVYGTLEDLSVIEHQLKDQEIYSSIMPDENNPGKHVLTVIHFVNRKPNNTNSWDNTNQWAQASLNDGIKVTASAHNHGHLYTVVAHTRGITESGLIVKACDCCCQKDDTYKNISVNFDLNEPEKVSFNMNFDGPKEELLAFIQEQVQKLGVMLPNTAFDVSTANCTCPMCAQPEQQALFILETPETAKVSASTSLDTLKTYAAAHYKEYSIKDKDLNVVSSHMDNIKKESTFAESLSDMLMSNHNANTTIGALSETKASVKGDIFKKAKSTYVGVDADELDDALAYIERAVSAIRNNNKPPLSAKELLTYCAVVLKAGNKNEKEYAKSVRTYVKEHPEEFLAVPDADDNLSDVNDLTNSVPSTKSEVSSVFEEEPLRSLISLDQLTSDVYQKIFAPDTTLELLNEAKDNLSNFLSIIDSSSLPVEQYHKAKMSLTSLLKTCEFKIKKIKENSLNTKGSSYTNQETGETKEIPTEVEEKLNPTKEPIMTVKTNGVEEEWWKNDK